MEPDPALLRVQIHECPTAPGHILRLQCVPSHRHRQTPHTHHYTPVALTWDVVILALTIVGMRRQKLPPRSTLWTALLGQGFTYLVITCVTCIPMMIMAMLNLNGACRNSCGDLWADSEVAESLSVMMAAPGASLSALIGETIIDTVQVVHLG